MLLSLKTKKVQINKNESNRGVKEVQVIGAISLDPQTYNGLILYPFLLFLDLSRKRKISDGAVR